MYEYEKGDNGWSGLDYVDRWCFQVTEGCRGADNRLFKVRIKGGPWEFFFWILKRKYEKQRRRKLNKKFLFQASLFQSKQGSIFILKMISKASFKNNLFIVVQK